MEKTMGPMISLGHRGNRSGDGQSLFIHKHLAYYMPDIILDEETGKLSTCASSHVCKQQS